MTRCTRKYRRVKAYQETECTHFECRLLPLGTAKRMYRCDLNSCSSGYYGRPGDHRKVILFFIGGRFLADRLSGKLQLCKANLSSG